MIKTSDSSMNYFYNQEKIVILREKKIHLISSIFHPPRVFEFLLLPPPALLALTTNHSGPTCYHLPPPGLGVPPLEMCLLGLTDAPASSLPGLSRGNCIPLPTALPAPAPC